MYIVIFYTQTGYYVIKFVIFVLTFVTFDEKSLLNELPALVNCQNIIQIPHRTLAKILKLPYHFLRECPSKVV